jgi:hypothetical protein
MSRRGSGLLGVVSAVQRAHSQAQRAEQQRLRANDLAQRKERQEQRASLDRIKLEMKKLEMRRKIPSPLTDHELVVLVELEQALAFQFPLSPEERAQGGRLHALALQAQREAEEEAAALLRQEQAAAEIAQLHETAILMNEQSRFMREHGGLVAMAIGAAVLMLSYVIFFAGR